MTAIRRAIPKTPRRAPPPAERMRDRRMTRALLAWYARFARDLPWRGSPDSYAVWVSEVMLQQTRVETVRPYYARFLRKFPTVGKLAAAPLSDVLKVWEGMGYYSRARNLHRAAGIVVKEFSGRLPRTAADLARLPGIGKYTTAAIASIAFGEDEPVLDGNVVRVLCRLFAVGGDPNRAAVFARLERIARRLLPAGRAGEFNQAMMDLGATVCAPRSPRCDDCPLRRHCRARALGRQERFPQPAACAVVPHYDVAVGVIWDRGRILIARRPDEGLLGGLWELPGGKLRPGETPAAAFRREVREETGLQIADLRPLAVVRHAYSHFRVTLHAFQCRRRAGRARPRAAQELRWVRPDELGRFAFPRANRKIFEALAVTRPKR